MKDTANEQLQPMEKLIIAVVAQGSENMASKLEKRFLANPLSTEDCQSARKILEETLGRETKYVLFNVFGLDGEKMSQEEIARSMRYPTERIRQLYVKAFRKIAKTDAIYKLKFLAYSDDEAYAMVATRQIALQEEADEMSRMMTALEAKTGKKSIENRHPIWDEFSLWFCRDLAAQGIMTLEDISEMGVRANRLKNIHGDMWFVISEALDRYGLDNRIASCPPIRPERFEDIAVKNSEEEIKIYFHPATYEPNPEKVRDELGYLICHNICIGGDLNQLTNGEIKLFFNPLIHGGGQRDRAKTRMESLIKSARIE